MSWRPAGNDKRIRVWTIGESRPRHRLRSTLAHTAAILRLAYSPDGSRLVSSSSDREVKLWDAATGEPVRTFPAQSDWSQALAFSPDGRSLAVGRYDGTLSLFDAASGRRVTELITPPRPPAASRGSGTTMRRDPAGRCVLTLALALAGRPPPRGRRRAHRSSPPSCLTGSSAGHR